IVGFNPKLNAMDNLADAFCIFTSGWDTCPLPAWQTLGEDRHDVIEVAFTDGSAYDTSTTSARAGAGVWYGKDDPRNKAIKQARPQQTNNAGEIHAML
ncbi:hypothetical protein IW262DRAFT_1244179, partial [Armillaria fumosa]